MTISAKWKRVIRSSFDTLVASLVVLGVAIPLLNLSAETSAKVTAALVAVNVFVARLRVLLADTGIIGEPTSVDPPNDGTNQDDGGVNPDE